MDSKYYYFFGVLGTVQKGKGTFRGQCLCAGVGHMRVLCAQSQAEEKFCEAVYMYATQL